MFSPQNLSNVPEAPPTEGQTKTKPPGPRRKACEQCFSKKLRCDHRRPTCSRCVKRKLDCTYSSQVSSSSSPANNESFIDTEHSLDISNFSGFEPDEAALSGVENQSIIEIANHGPHSRDTDHIGTSASAETSEQSDFSGIQLVCPVDCERIQTRWLEGFAPAPDRQAKSLSPGMTFFVLTAMRAYPHMLTVPDVLPPFIHAKQLPGGHLPTALARCASVAHMWAYQVSGAEDMLREIIDKETKALYEWILSNDAPDSRSDVARLAALQAYLLYCLMLLPTSMTDPVAISQDTKINLQDLTSRAARTGLLSPEEESTRPPWESWILAEAKRRTIYAVYMFDDIVNTLNHLPCVLGDELGILPMTCSKTLWSATDKKIWEEGYNRMLASGRELRLQELWVHPAGEEIRQKRERWLAGVDEYGMMIFAITSITQLH